MYCESSSRRRRGLVAGTLLLLALAVSPLLHAAQGERGLLWTISKPGMPVSYLFGTIHSEDPRVIDLPGRVREALAHSEALALEMEMTDEVNQRFAAGMVLPEGSELESLLGDELFEYTAEAMAARGYSEAQIQRLKPWAAMLALSVPSPQTGEFLDLLLYRLAQVSSMSVISLEQPDEILAIFDGISLADQRQLLYETVVQYRNFDALFEALISAYLMRDLDGLEALQEDSLTFGGDERLKKVYLERFVTQRNQRMLERVLPRLEQQSVFIAVGALHLPGDTGLINLLEQAGYHLESIY